MHKNINQDTNIEGLLPKLFLILIISKKTWEQSGPLGVIFRSWEIFVQLRVELSLCIEN